MTYPATPSGHTQPLAQTRASTVLDSASLGATVGAAAAAARQLRSPTRPGKAALGEILGAGAVAGFAAGTLAYMRQNARQPSGLATAATLFVAGTALMYVLEPQTRSGLPQKNTASEE